MEKKLNKMFRLTDKYIENLNTGGCGHFAKWFYFFNRKLFIDLKIVYVHNACPIESYNVKERNTSCCHVFLKSEYGYFDGYRMCGKRWTENCFKYDYPIKALSKALVKGNWSSYFNKRKNLVRIIIITALFRFY